MQSKLNDGGSAFPQQAYVCQPDGSGRMFVEYHQGSLSVRDYFAAAALQCCYNNPYLDSELSIAERCYKRADEMLAERDFHRSKQHTTKGTTMPPNEQKGHGKPNTGGSDESAGVPPAVPPYTDYSPEVPLPDGKILLLPVNISHHENPGGIMIQRQEYKVHAEPYFSEVLLPGQTEYQRVGPWGPSVPVDGYQGVMELPLSGPEGNRGWRIVEDP